jgi:Uma2 family endonuclease
MAEPARQPSAPLPPPPLTVEEYLALDNDGSLRHEYVAGEMYAMTGGTLRHNLIAGRIYRLLAAAGEGPCRVFMSDVKVQAASDRFYFPDVAVVCGPVEQSAYVARQPCLVVEVTSPSTRRADRGEKLDAYLRNPAIQAYLIVEQGVREVEPHWRDELGEWQHATVADATDGRIPVSCPETVITLDEIYQDIELDPPEEALPTRPRRVREAEPV